MTLANVLAVVQPGKDLLHSLLLGTSFLQLQTLATHASLLLLVLQSLLDELDIFQAKLFADDIKITGRVDITLDVNNLGIVEATNDLEDGIDGTDVGQERVAKTSASGRATGQTSNVVNRQVGRDAGLGVVLFREPVVTVIRNNDARLFRLDCGVREVLAKLSAP